MAYGKEMRLIRRLADLTEEGRIDWQASIHEGTFQVSFRDNTLRIATKPTESFGEPEDAVDVEVQLLNESGTLVEKFTDFDLQHDHENEEESGYWYKLLLKLYESAQKRALGASKVLDEILAELDDDIPF